MLAAMVALPAAGMLLALVDAALAEAVATQSAVRRT